jgi:hypothetical protein
MYRKFNGCEFMKELTNTIFIRSTVHHCAHITKFSSICEEASAELPVARLLIEITIKRQRQPI